MEYEKRIEELRKLGEATGGDPNEIDEHSYWSGFRSAWDSGFTQGLSEGREKAMAEFNIHLPLKNT